MKATNTVARVSANGPALLSALRDEMVNSNPSYADRLPEVTRDSLREFGAYLSKYDAAANDFIRSMVNLIGRVQITYTMFTNPLRALKKGELEFGDTVEMVYASLPKAHAFNPADAEKLWMKREIPNVMTAFARLNYKVFYKMTLEEDDMRAGFMDWAAFDRMISMFFAQMTNAAEQDEFLTMKQQLAAYAAAGGFAVATIPAVTDQTSAQVALAKIKAVSNSLPFFSTNYNGVGAYTMTPKNKQVLLVDANTDAYLSVLGYATLFNLEPARAQYRVIQVDEIPIDGVSAILMDEDLYQVFDNLQKFRKAENGEGLYWQYWAHYWRIIALCPWANAVAFVTTTPTVTAITLTAPADRIPYGGEGTVTKKVTGTGLYPQAVVYTLAGNTSESTVISPFGTIYVDQNETATSLTVTATSTFDSDITGTVTVPIGTAPTPPEQSE